MSDRYDDAIEILVETPEVLDAWGDPDCKTDARMTAAHALFQHATPTGRSCLSPEAEQCGCLTQIRYSDRRFAWTPSLTAEIRADERIPASILDFEGRFRAASPDERRAMLQPFAEWQRRLDREIRGVEAA